MVQQLANYFFFFFWSRFTVLKLKSFEITKSVFWGFFALFSSEDPHCLELDSRDHCHGPKGISALSHGIVFAPLTAATQITLQEGQLKLPFYFGVVSATRYLDFHISETSGYSTVVSLHRPDLEKDFWCRLSLTSSKDFDIIWVFLF